MKWIRLFPFKFPSLSFHFNLFSESVENGGAASDEDDDKEDPVGESDSEDDMDIESFNKNMKEKFQTERWETKIGNDLLLNLKLLINVFFFISLLYHRSFCTLLLFLY